MEKAIASKVSIMAQGLKVTAELKQELVDEGYEFAPHALIAHARSHTSRSIGERFRNKSTRVGSLHRAT